MMRQGWSTLLVRKVSRVREPGGAAIDSELSGAIAMAICNATKVQNVALCSFKLHHTDIYL